MTTIKSFTDLEQSKKLAEILPLESADNYYSWHDERYYVINKDCPYPYSLKEKIPCWSLAALLNVLPNTKLCHYDDGYFCQYMNRGDEFPTYSTNEYNNPVDACYELILKLHEFKML